MKKPKIRVDNVLKIVDVEHTEISSPTLMFLTNDAEPTYQDMKLNEHIYNIDNIYDDYRELHDSDEEILSELECLMGLLRKKQAGYLRIVYN